MSVLDENRKFIDPADVSIWPTVLKYGLILGLVSIVFRLVGFLIGVENMNFTMMGLSFVVGLAVTVAILRAAIKYFRDEELGGYITLGKCLALGVPIFLLGTLMDTLFQYVYVNFVDPSIIDQTVQLAVNMAESFGAELGEEQIAELEAETRSSMQIGKLLLTGLGTGAVGGLILSLIIGAVMKKEAPIIA